MDLNRNNLKKIMFLIVFAIAAFEIFHNISGVIEEVSGLIDLIAPFLIGFCIAFVVNLLMSPMERLWNRIWKKRKGKWKTGLRRPVCLILSMLLLIGSVFAVVFIIVPQLQEAGNKVSGKIPQYVDIIEGWWDKLSIMLEERGIVLPDLSLDNDAITEAVGSIFETQGNDVVNKTLEITRSIVGGVVNSFLGIIFSLYILSEKELWKARTKRLLQAVIPDKYADKVLEITELANVSFSNYVTGQVTEALIIGSLCFVGMLIFSFPYALPISILICFTALIPIFGAFIGAGVSAFLIFIESPVKALWFIVFILVLQQLEDNLIYPKVVGKSVGLPGIWVLLAVTVGGGAFGIFGMLVSVPLCAVIYELVQKYVRKNTAIPVTEPENVQEKKEEKASE